MVSEQEYLNALNTIETYRIEEFLRTNEVGSITFKEFYFKYGDGMSERLKNVFSRELLDHKFYTYLHEVTPKKILHFRNVGKKSRDEYEILYYLEVDRHKKSLENAIYKLGISN
tara:strand:- start:313 stop:654 length:342 start_codon:yes stop_codon:yes gene_type:complete